MQLRVYSKYSVGAHGMPKKIVEILNPQPTPEKQTQFFPFHCSAMAAWGFSFIYAVIFGISTCCVFFRIIFILE